MTLPLEIFTCKTIVKLKLGIGINIALVHENASLPALKTLFLCCIRFSGCGFETLLSACHVLKELSVYGDPWDREHWKQCRTVSCPTLERLTIRCKTCSGFDASRGIAFDTPSLAYLDYHDFVFDEYPIVNLNSLVEADLSLKSINKGDPKNLIKGLRNVEILNLSSTETSEVFYSFAEKIPLFKNLSRLSIATGLGSCWEFVPSLLKKCPNLETLVIKGPLHFYDEYGDVSESLCECLSGYSFLLSCPVKVLEITEYWGTEGDLEHMKHFLGKLPCLELVNVRVGPEAELPFTTDLLMLPRASNIRLNMLP